MGGQALLKPKAKKLRFLVRDEFTTPLAAGAVNGTLAEPGPGTRTVVDAENRIAVSGGGLTYSGKNDDYATELGYENFARKTGRTILAKYALTDIGGYVSWGLEDGLYLTELLSVLADSFWIGTVRLSNQTSGIVANTYRSSGHLSFAKVGGVWKLAWVGRTSTTSPAQPNLVPHVGGGRLDYIRVADLPAPFNVDVGLPTYKLSGNVPNVTTFTHNPNCRIEFTIGKIPALGGVTWDNLSFRQQAGDSSYFFYLWSSGDLQLIEAVGGVNTGIGTFAVAAGTRISVDVNGANIQVFKDGVSQFLYQTARYQTENDGSVAYYDNDGMFTDLVIYPLPSEAMGIATNWLPGRRVAGATFTHEADCIIEFVASLDAAGVLKFRKQGAIDFIDLIWLMDGYGELRKCINGAYTTVATFGAGTIKNGSRVVVLCEGADINIYVDNVVAGTGSIDEFKTETDGALDLGSCSDLVIWPRTLTGQAEAILNKYSKDYGTVGGPNLALNPGFETAGAGGADVWADWSETPGVDGTFEDDAVNKHSGNHSAKIICGPSLGSVWLQTNVSLNVTAGQRYELRYWTAGDGAHDGAVGIFNAEGGTFIITGPTGVTSTTFTEVVKTFTIPAGCEHIYIFLMGAYGNGAYCNFDDIVLRMI